MYLALALFAVHSLPTALGILAALLVGVTLTYTGTNGGALDQLLGTFGPYVDQDICGLQIVAAAGPTAIAATHGKVVATYAGVAAMTLAAPVAGSPAAGGNDGQTLKIIDVSGHAHTITTGASGINGNHHIATSSGSAGDEISFTAYNGVWYCNPAGTNWTIS
jgi:hypothetical protein